MCEDMTSCTDLACHHVVNEIARFCIATVTTVVASIFLVSAASCKAICKVTLVRTSAYSQPFWLK